MTIIRTESRETAALSDKRKESSSRVRFLELFTTLREGEGRCVLYFSIYAFLLLLCYYIVKTLREPLLLVAASAELKSYAYATTALVLLALVPLYGALLKRTSRALSNYWVTGFFLAGMIVFCLLGRAGADIGFAYYVWVGVFGVMILAQFWAHAADTFSVSSGKRLFPAIMAGATLGSLVGPSLVGALFATLGPWPLVGIAAIALAATVPLIRCSRAAVPREAQNPVQPAMPSSNTLGGFRLVLRDRYLSVLALLVLLLNCVNTMGEYLLTDRVLGLAADRASVDSLLDEGVVIAGFYANYYLAINALTVLAQLFLVARLFQWIGVRRTTLVLPIIALVGYSLFAVLPIFGVLQLVKILENGADYSVMNTSRQALYLPLSSEHKYQGKIAIDTFFYRLGDVLQAGIIFIGVNVFDFSFHHFAIMNACLAAVWLAVAVSLGRRFDERASEKAQASLLNRVVALCREPAFNTRLALRHHRGLAALVLALMLGALTVTASVPTEANSIGRLDDRHLLDPTENAASNSRRIYAPSLRRVH